VRKLSPLLLALALALCSAPAWAMSMHVPASSTFTTATIILPANYKRHALCIQNTGASQTLVFAIGTTAAANAGVILEPNAATWYGQNKKCYYAKGGALLPSGYVSVYSASGTTAAAIDW